MNSLYFLASKVLWFGTGPTALLSLIGGLGLVLLALGRARRLATASLALFVAGTLALGYLPVANWLLWPLEARFPPFRDDGRPIAGVILLGGAIETRGSTGREQMILNEAGERVVALTDLARRYPTVPVIFSGGSGEMLGDREPEADILERHLAELGLPAGRITYERRSRNTAENARMTAEIAKPEPGQRWLLVTSAWHMPRAMGLFRAAGIPVVAYPVDYRTADMSDLYRPFPTLGDGLRRSELALREWLGLIAGYTLGHSTELLPSP